MLVAIDLGNTAVKLGAFDGTRLVAFERVDVRRSLAEDLIPFAHLLSADEVVALASSPRRAEEFAAWTPRPARVLGDEVRAAFRMTYLRPSELGLDRIAAAVGARSLTGAASVAVAGAGTAITVDALDRAGRFVAVAIAPGLRAAADGLHAAAPHLAYPDLAAGAAQVPARGSADALRNGHLIGLAGLVDRLLDEATLAAGGVDVSVLTGGAGPSLSPFLRTPHRNEPHAVLHGIRVLHAEVPR
jgi:pantothenate kinase type III